MSEPLSEAAGCALLARLFRERGYTIRRNVVFKEFGVSFHIDGWDAAARVGFEFLSSEKEDHDDLTLREFEKLKDAEARGELFLFIIDEVEPLSAAVLRQMAVAFLDEVAQRRRPARGATRRTAAAAKSGPRAGAARVTRKRPTVVKKSAATGTPPKGRPVKPGTRTTGTAKPSAVKRPVKRPAKKKSTGARRR